MIVSLFQICHCPRLLKNLHTANYHVMVYTITIEQTNPRATPHTRTVKLAPPNHLLIFPSKISNIGKIQLLPPKKVFFVSHVPSCSADTLGRFLGFCFCGRIRFTSNNVKKTSIQLDETQKYRMISPPDIIYSWKTECEHKSVKHPLCTNKRRPLRVICHQLF